MDFTRDISKYDWKRYITIIAITVILFLTATVVTFKQGEQFRARADNWLENAEDKLESTPYVGDFYSSAKERFVEDPIATTAGVGTGVGGIALASWLSGESDERCDPDQLSNDASTAFANRLNTVFRNFMNISTASQYNYWKLANTSELHLIRKAEYAAMQMKDEGYDYFPAEEVFVQSGVSEMMLNLLIQLNTEQMAIINGMSDNTKFFEDTYSDMECGIQSTNGETYSSISATGSQRYEVLTGYSFSADKYYYFGNQPMYVFFWDGLDAEMYLQDTEGNKIPIDAHDIETPTYSVSDQPGWDVNNDKNLGCYKIDPQVDTSNFPKRMKLVIDGGTGSTYPVGFAFDNIPDDLYPAHIGFEVNDTDGDGKYEKFDDWEVKGMTRHEGSVIRTAVWDDNNDRFEYGDTKTYEFYSKGGGERYSTSIKPILNQTFNIVQRVKNLWGTVRNSAEAQFELYDEGDPYFPIDAAFANMEQIEQMNMTEIKILASAYVKFLRNNLENDSYQIDVDDMNVTEEAFQGLRITGYVTDGNGSYVLGSPSDLKVFAPHVSTQSVNISTPYHVMQQNGLLLYFGDAINSSSTRITDGSDRLRVMNLESGYNMTITSMSIDSNDNNIPEYVDSIGLNVKEWGLMAPSIGSGGAGAPTDVTTPEEFIWEWIKRLWIPIAFGVLGLTVSIASNSGTTKGIGFILIMIGCLIGAIQIWVIPALNNFSILSFENLKNIILYWSG